MALEDLEEAGSKDVAVLATHMRYQAGMLEQTVAKLNEVEKTVNEVYRFVLAGNFVSQDQCEKRHKDNAGRADAVDKRVDDLASTLASLAGSQRMAMWGLGIGLPVLFSIITILLNYFHV